MKLNKSIYYLLSSILFVLGLLMLLEWFDLIIKENIFFYEWEINFSNSVSVNMSLILDYMSVMFLMVVSFISSMILGYSKYYMKEEKSFNRFLWILVCFIISMWFMIISPNLVSLLLGWDGLGLTSYALVIYYQSENSCNAGMLTVLSNRIGDVCILLSISLMFCHGSWNFIMLSSTLTFLMSGLMMLAGFTKSAQIPFSAWLPAAMAAPTPVSALVHSSTLVTAGVFLLIRFYPYLDKHVGVIILIISVSTMFMAGLSANFETDFKKIIALSTLSQLGLMLMEVGFGMPNLAFSHLIVHALFKATIFMCAGVVIHMSMGSQDNRGLGSLNLTSPLLGVIFGGMNLALCGFPYLSGFFSKDLILESVISGFSCNLIMLMIILATGFTVSYSLRVMFLSVSLWSNLSCLHSLLDESLNVSGFMFLFFFFSVSGGGLIAMSLSQNFQGFLMFNYQKYYIMMICLGFIIFFGTNIKDSWFILKLKMSSGFNFFTKMWFSFFESVFFSEGVFFKGSFGLKTLDKGWLEYGGGQGSGLFSFKMSSYFQMSQISVVVLSYLSSFMSLGILMMMFYYFKS